MFHYVTPVSTRLWFYEFTNCDDIDCTNLNTSKVTDMYGMFGYTSFHIIDVSALDTSNVTTMSQMFITGTVGNSTNNLTTIYSNDSNFITTNVESSTYMFRGCSKLVGGNGTTYSSSKIDASMAHVDTASNPGYFTAK